MNHVGSGVVGMEGDRQIVKRRLDDLMPLLVDPPGFESFATPRIPLKETPRGYYLFEKKQDGVTKILLLSSNVGGFSGRRKIKAGKMAASNESLEVT